MIAENVVAHKNNNIPLTDKEWQFKTFEDRPALIRIKEDRVSLYIGEKTKKSIYDGQFILSHSWKLEEYESRFWDTVKARLDKLQIQIFD